jgi:hypothetical protein
MKVAATLLIANKAVNFAPPVFIKLKQTAHKFILLNTYLVKSYKTLRFLLL